MATVRTRKPKRRGELNLWFHAGTGQWCKQVNRQVLYFGADEAEAVQRAKDEIPRVRKGQPRYVEKTPLAGGAKTIAEVCHLFLESKRKRVVSEELQERSWQEYRVACEIVRNVLGKHRTVGDLGPDDFARLRDHLASTCGLYLLKNRINRIKSIFKFAFAQGHIPAVVPYGDAFAPPPKRLFKIQRRERGPRFVAAADCRKLLAKADVVMKAMIYLALNAGLGNTDLSDLPKNKIKGKWLDYIRQKTGEDRKAALWPETIAAVKAAIAVRPAAADKADDGCVFLTRFGRRWVRHTKKADGTGSYHRDSIAQEFRKLAASCGLEASFYDLRHTYRTAADASLDTPGIRWTMGHADGSIDSAYREFIDDTRLKRIAAVVRNWLAKKK